MDRYELILMMNQIRMALGIESNQILGTLPKNDTIWLIYKQKSGEIMRIEIRIMRRD